MNTPPRLTPVTMNGKSFDFPLRYSSGHVCNATEAAVLNKALCDMIRKVLDKRGSRSTEELTQEKFLALVEAYTFNKNSGLRLFSEDPAIAEAARLARIALCESLRTQRIDPDERGEEWLENATQELLQRQPSFLVEAQQRLLQRRSAAAEVLEDL